MESPETRQHRELIIQATLDCLSSQGFHQLSVQDVAKKAGVSKGIIHYYFLNKDELMLCVFHKMSENIQKELKLLILDEQDVCRTVEKMIEKFLSLAQTTSAFYWVNVDFWGKISNKADLHQAVCQRYDEMKGLWVEILKKGQGVGQFRLDLDPGLYGALALGLMEGLALRWLFNKENFAYHEMSSLVKSILLERLCMTC